ncbi:MAG TPA: isoleucine--tRNA ligase, partial [Lactobacillus sp.]|nr:isoleucine--tRNA ligase [Lactobacillus sp.]
DPQKDAIAYDDLGSLDRYLMVRLNQVIAKVKAAYDVYDFATVEKTISSFLVNDLSAFYLDVAKDVVYIEAQNDPKRRSMQTVMYTALLDLTKLLTPILPHTAEEVWPYLKQDSAYAALSDMPDVTHFDDEDQLLDIWSAFMDFRSEVQKALEVARDNKVIGKSMEAAVTVYPSGPVRDMLDDVEANVMQLLITSHFEVAPSDAKAPADAEQFEDMAVVVTHAKGEVCPRCRMVRTDIGTDPKLPELCSRCAAIVEANYPEAVANGFDK